VAKKRKIDRDTELGTKADIEDQLEKIYSDIDEGFRNQAERSDDQVDYWDIYNTKLNGNQYYSGTSKIYVPIVHNAVNARAVRFVNQIFPKGGRYVEVTAMNGDIPHAETALIENYVRKAKLRTEVAFPLVVNGDIEGQYNVYVGWSSVARHVVWKEKRPPSVAGTELPEELVEEDDLVEEIKEDVILDDHPVVEVLPDADVLILPVTVNSVEQALEVGGSVTIIRRWTKAELKKRIADGDVIKVAADAMLEEMSKAEKQGIVNAAKSHADAAGIKAKGKQILVYEVWTKLKIDKGGSRRLCCAFLGGDNAVLSAKLNPYWNDRCPLISAPVKKVSGVVKGQSQVQPCAQLQYAANDAVNEGMDSAAYALLPIVMTDPLKNPRVNTMILDLAAVWETNPNDTKFASFPPLWKEAFDIIAATKNEIFQTLSVTPAQMPQGTGGKSKRNQAEIATEQQVDIMQTADSVTVLEESIFTPIIERFAEYDAQFRDDDITVKAYGHMGMRAAMETIPPLQMGRRLSFLWFGVEQARNAAQIQQQIAFMNVLRGIPPQMLPGRRIDMVPAIEQAMSAIFGSRIAPLVFVDTTKENTFPPEVENDLMDQAVPWPVSPMDDDVKHIESHMKSGQEDGDAHGFKAQHIAEHHISMQKKAMQQQAQGQPGTPGGGKPGIAGVPKPGAQPANPRQMKGPPGAIPQDSMPKAGAVTMPRRN
jgi:hypothetical protein